MLSMYWNSNLYVKFQFMKPCRVDGSERIMLRNHRFLRKWEVKAIPTPISSTKPEPISSASNIFTILHYAPSNWTELWLVPLSADACWIPQWWRVPFNFYYIRSWGTGVQSQVELYQRLKKWYLTTPYLTLSIIRYISRVKWSNPGKRVVSSLTPQCSSNWKRSLQVALDYSHQLYLLLYWEL